MSIAKDSIVKGKVSGITKFGAFIKLESGLEGLVHISEIADTYVKNINDYLKLGDEISVKVLGHNKQGKLDLSLKKVSGAASEIIEVVEIDNCEPVEVVEPDRERNDRDRNEYINKSNNNKKRKINSDDPFEAKMNAFLKKSEEKLLDLKRNVQEKQGYKKRKRS
ncbi:MAG: RNA-binding protein S1 [Candidatus Margulisiibacteriota bacterium]|nr:MAG: hypothetical protein A2X43_12955 [Candidatus Margulisbacteria bacterium GWD2_39_127]OGI02136.1 MAG: hypothetical protein A2X42_01570 [Candidatus Margulisbacteria bacterium GWF2_38_17]OGI10512.1 MAG: hypothetical protein A2X41_07070 [Candidatus Margulisbacteria bacterium GWE2_39_32]PZM79941.1 MAG: RNA-binding protein S1 [Candidatus Margulisiibacteriota bacterium]HAR62403.1 RNA-binding protein S1 [Candidatus Margulisiibacteriota bacterium]